jgi:glycerol-3-phosphate dehydrogenase
MARDALKAARKYLGRVDFNVNTPVLDSFPPDTELCFADTTLSPAQQVRLLARYGIESIPQFAADASQEPIPDTPYLWSELRHAARAEGVIHLDDLLLRRVRLGLLAPNGGIDLLAQIRSVVQMELSWDDSRWDMEVKEYSDLWHYAYALN